MVNKIILIGNLGNDPEVRALETGVKMARLRIATTERVYNASTGEKREHTEWHTVVLWRGLADFAEKYVHKGSQVYLEGRIRSREWTEESTGNRRYAVEILADEIRLLGGSARRGDALAESAPSSSAAPEAVTPEAVTQMPKDADDLPF